MRRMKRGPKPSPLYERSDTLRCCTGWLPLLRRFAARSNLHPLAASYVNFVTSGGFAVASGLFASAAGKAQVPRGNPAPFGHPGKLETRPGARIPERIPAERIPAKKNGKFHPATLRFQ